jgi:hypothetical protein
VFSDAAGRLAGLTGALLGWRPDDFWAVTPIELNAILAAMIGAPPPAGADELARLKEMFPDG